MPWAPAAIIGAATIGAGASIYGASAAADAQTEAANTAAALEREQYQQTRDDLAPWRESGAKGAISYADAIGLNGPEKQAAAMAGFREDPSYQYDFDEGVRATSGVNAARGSYLSGGSLKDLTRFGQATADRQFGSYLDRFLQASSLGQNAAAQTGNFGAGSAARQGQYATDAAAAKAGGYLSAAQGVNGAISNGLQLYGYGKGQGWFDGNSGGYTTPDGMPRGYYVNK